MEKYHVLVVEDDTEIANAIKIYLENQGYDVYVGNDGLEGLEIIEKRNDSFSNRWYYDAKDGWFNNGF